MKETGQSKQADSSNEDVNRQGAHCLGGMRSRQDTVTVRCPLTVIKPGYLLSLTFPD